MNDEKKEEAIPAPGDKPKTGNSVPTPENAGTKEKAPEPKPARKARQTKAKKKVDGASLRDVPHDKLPIDARGDRYEGAVRVHNGLPIVELQPHRWVGEAPLRIAVEELPEIIDLLSELRTQVEKSL